MGSKYQGRIDSCYFSFISEATAAAVYTATTLYTIYSVRRDSTPIIPRTAPPPTIVGIIEFTYHVYYICLIVQLSKTNFLHLHIFIRNNKIFKLYLIILIT